MVSPGVTPIDGQNPGIATFEVDKDSLKAQNLELTFIELKKTYGWESIPADISLVPFKTVKMSQFGLFSLTASAISQFRKNLDANHALAYKYLVSKVGYDPLDPTEFETGMSLYIDKLGIVSATQRKIYKYICQMYLNKNAAEMTQCINDAKN